MTKRIKKLSLNKETLKSLTGTDLAGVAGGLTGGCPPPGGFNMLRIRGSVTICGSCQGIC